MLERANTARFMITFTFNTFKTVKCTLYIPSYQTLNFIVEQSVKLMQICTGQFMPIDGQNN